MTRKTEKIPSIFTTDNEPYLGMESLLWFDRIIIWSMKCNKLAADYTISNRNRLDNLQKVACELIPQGLSIALSIRELIRQAYLFSAMILIRPLIERASVLRYLLQNPSEISVWETGWKYRDRPKLAKMLHNMNPSSRIEDAQSVCDSHNHMIHGDPVSSYFNLLKLPDGQFGYSSGKMLSNHELADNIAMEAQSYLIVITATIKEVFPSITFPELSHD